MAGGGCPRTFAEGGCVQLGGCTATAPGALEAAVEALLAHPYNPAVLATAARAVAELVARRPGGDEYQRAVNCNAVPAVEEARRRAAMRCGAPAAAQQPRVSQFMHGISRPSPLPPGAHPGWVAVFRECERTHQALAQNFELGLMAELFSGRREGAAAGDEGEKDSSDEEEESEGGSSTTSGR